MLDDTLVLFTTEFGRTPFTQTARIRLGGDATTIGMAFRLDGGRWAQARRCDRRNR